MFEGCTRYQELLSSLKADDHGFVHLGNDGVLRSFDASGNVIDYRQLSPDQIRDSINMYDAIGTEERNHLENVYRGVDGRQVPREKVLNPDENVGGQEDEPEQDQNHGEDCPSPAHYDEHFLGVRSAGLRNATVTKVHLVHEGFRNFFNNFLDVHSIGYYRPEAEFGVAVRCHGEGHLISDVPPHFGYI
ncbi:Lactobacillus up-regulated protein [Lasiodiplodia theobromae]|uniref:Lactobacillus up-regulated protein n=1 Tax=Lasiodiplodia theobromae TaxID=45133 RepID=A0A5N5D7M5_9PEZI|nr:Lactobacillus up-regulated protein [Lasiodiplodia theobromae]